MWRRILSHLILPVGLLCIIACALWLTFALRDPAIEAKSQSLQSDLSLRLQQNETLRREIAALESENQRLREDPEASLYYARTELGMVRPGETVYQFVDVEATERQDVQSQRRPEAMPAQESQTRRQEEGSR